MDKVERSRSRIQYYETRINNVALVWTKFAAGMLPPVPTYDRATCTAGIEWSQEAASSLQLDVRLVKSTIYLHRNIKYCGVRFTALPPTWYGGRYTHLRSLFVIICSIVPRVRFRGADLKAMISHICRFVPPRSCATLTCEVETKSKFRSGSFAGSG